MFFCNDFFILNAMRTVIFKESKHRSVKLFSDKEHKNDHGRCGYDICDIQGVCCSAADIVCCVVL